MFQTTLNRSSEAPCESATPSAAPQQAETSVKHYIGLEPNAAYTLDRNTHSVKALAGRAWISLDGQDHVVEPGCEFVLPVPHNRAIISGLSRHTIYLEIR